jgi:hypothetical protein
MKSLGWRHASGGAEAFDLAFTRCASVPIHDSAAAHARTLEGLL